MKTKLLVVALLSISIAGTAFSAPPRIFRVAEDVAPTDARGYMPVQVFYETNFTSYVCVNVLANTAGSCGNGNIKKCYDFDPSVASSISGIADVTKKINISIEEGSLKNYAGISEESREFHNYLYVFSVVDTTNHKRCNVNVSGKHGTLAFEEGVSDKSCVYDASRSCVTISMDCINDR